MHEPLDARATARVLAGRKKIVFIDDTETHFVGCEKHGIACFLIVRHPIPCDEPLSLRAKTVWVNSSLPRMYDPLYGIDAAGFACLTSMLGRVKYVIIDWDRTLTLCRAISKEAGTSYQAAECYFGGTTRMRAMRRFFGRAYFSRTRTVVLTCNPMASTHPKHMSKILRHVGGGWVPIVHTTKKIDSIRTICGIA